MAKSTSKPKGWLIGRQQVKDWEALATRQMADQDYTGAIRTVKRIMQYVPRKDKVFAEALGSLGTIYALQKDFEESYQAYTQALAIDGENAYLFYNRGISARLTFRTGQSLLDLEYAAEIEGDGKMTEKIQKALDVARELVLSEITLRGPGFTVELLIEQQEYFQEGLALMKAGKWQLAVEDFSHSIELADCLPQPWGNRGICHLMLGEFDQSEAAFNRALEIDPEYDLARTNMKEMPYWRAHPDEKPRFVINQPLADVNTNLSLV